MVLKVRIKGYHLLSYEIIISAAYMSLRASFPGTARQGKCAKPRSVLFQA